MLPCSKNSCDQTGMRESSRKLGTKDHGIQRHSTHCNAVLCYALGWLSWVDMPSPFWNKISERNENWRPSRRKRWVGCGNGRCAHRRINHTRVGSRPAGRGRRSAFFRTQKSPIFVPNPLVHTENTRNARSYPFIEISPKPDVGPRLGRQLNRDSAVGSPRRTICGLEISRGALWTRHDGRLWPGNFAGAGRGTETRPCQCRAEIRPWAGQAGAVGLMRRQRWRPATRAPASSPCGPAH
jgi:hypothetical protein